MSPLFLLLSLAVVDILSILSPGPNILLVTQTAVEHDRSRALLVALGIVTASVFWACVALTGLTALFEMMPSLQMALRIAGAAFLIYLGIRLWRAPAAQPATPNGATGRITYKAILHGFVTSMLNPKSLAYFGTIFVLFVPADASIELRLAALSIVAVDSLLVYGLAAALFSTDAAKKAYLALRRPIDRICGTVMMAFGVNLIWNRA